VKNQNQCPKCGSEKLGYLESVPDMDDGWPPDHAIIGYQETTEPGWLESTKTTKHEMEAYICASCGFLEYYAKNPAAIRFENIPGFRWKK